MSILWNILLIVAGVVLLVMLLFLLVVLLFLLVPVVLVVDTSRELYRITFLGGMGRLRPGKGEKSLEYSILGRKGIWKLDQKSHREEIPPDPEKEEEKSHPFPRKILKMLCRESELIRLVIQKTGRLLKGLVCQFRLSYLRGTFCLGDPFMDGILSGVLWPMASERFHLVPNFIDEGYLKARVQVVPGGLLLQGAIFVLTLPLLRLYRLYREYQRDRETIQKKTNERGSEK